MGETRGEPLGQLASAYTRHDHVGQQEMDFGAVTACQALCFRRRMRFDHFVAALAENHVRQLTDVLFVLDEQDGFVALLVRGGGPFRRRLDGVGDAWQINLEGGALSKFAVYPDVAAALFHNAIDRRETEASATSAFLGGVKRLEDMGDRLGLHAGAGVRDGEQHVRSGNDNSVIARVRRVENNVAGFDEDAAAVEEGVARVHDQIHNDLFDLARVGLDGSEIFGDERLHLNVFVHQSAKELVEIHNNRVEIEDFRPQNLLAAEGQ